MITLADADQIYERIYAEIGLVDADIVPLMLKLLVLEKEEERLERRVNIMCDSNLELIASLQQKADEEDDDDDDHDEDEEDNDDEDNVDSDGDDVDIDTDQPDDVNEQDSNSEAIDHDVNTPIQAPVLRVKSGELLSGASTLAPLNAPGSKLPKKSKLAPLSEPNEDSTTATAAVVTTESKHSSSTSESKTESKKSAPEAKSGGRLDSEAKRTSVAAAATAHSADPHTESKQEITPASPSSAHSGSEDEDDEDSPEIRNLKFEIDNTQFRKFLIRMNLSSKNIRLGLVYLLK